MCIGSSVGIPKKAWTEVASALGMEDLGSRPGAAVTG